MSTVKGLVHVVDDDLHLRNSMADLLRFAGYAVSTWPHAQGFLEGVRWSDDPAVVVTDMRMPGLSGLDLHQTLLQRGRPLPVIYVSGESSVQQSIAAMKLGAVDFLIKPFTAQDLLAAIEKGLARDREWIEAETLRALREARLETLTRREREVFDLLLKGCNNTEIMQAMNLSLPTTKQHKGAVMKKLEVSSLAQLIEWAKASGIHAI